MEHALHIDTSGGRCWYRCKRARIVDGAIAWEVSPSGRYDLLGAYEKEAHRQFVRADDDEKLLGFLRTWGPFANELHAPEGKSSLETLRRNRQELEAWTKLFAALDSPANPRDVDSRQSLIELFHFAWDTFAIYTRVLLKMPKNSGFDAIEPRLANMSRDEFNKLCGYVVGAFPGAALANSLVIERSRTGTRLRAIPVFVGLLDALNWMVWQDIYLAKPFTFCFECRRLIPSTTGHARRFCDASERSCATKWTDREWKRKKRKTEREKRKKESRHSHIDESKKGTKS